MFWAKLTLFASLSPLNFSFGSETACGCVSRIPSNANVSRKVKYERKQSKAVFSGQVIEVVERNTNLSYENVISFRVIESWKRVRTSTIKIITPRPALGSCGYDFQVGESYLVYVERMVERTDDEDLWTGICSRTMMLASAVEDLQVLGKGKRF
jgi:hypothetical protein